MDAVSFRMDHTFNSRLSVFGRYNRSPSHNIFRFVSLSTVQDQEANTTTFTTGANWLISSIVSDSFRFNYSNQTTSCSNHLDNFACATSASQTLMLAHVTTHSLCA